MLGVTHDLLALVADEVAARAGGARVRAAHQDAEHAFRLSLERDGGRLDLVLDLDPDGPAAYLAEARPAPGQPGALAHGLRNALEGARLEGARVVPGERALALTFSLAGLPRTLWFEGFGRQANLYLLDEHGVVALTPRGEVAARRQAAVGQRFVPTPSRASAPAPDLRAPGEGASACLERLLKEQRAARALAAQRADLERRLRQGLAKAEGAIQALERMERRGEQVAELRRKGELLRASFHLLHPGQARVTVPDYAQDPPVEVTLELDPTVPPGEQVGACFEEAQKAERAQAEARARLPQARAQVRRLREAQALLAQAADARGLAEVETVSGLVAAGRAARAGQGAAPAVPWRTFTSQDGWRILVGKDARGNDRLTLHEAAPHDLFLHVRGSSGSHVIVPTPRGKSVPLPTLLDAAELACVYSGRAGAPHNEVDYVERRYVRKPKGSPPGLVELARSKTLRVTRDDTRRERLRATLA